MLDPRTHHPMNSFQLYDGTRHKTQNYHDTWEATNSGLWPSRQAQFGTEPNEVDESGIYTHGNQYRINHNRSLSPDSRTQAIARGQRELMEMVRNMPESSYELSLKDLVEQHHRVNPRQEETVVEERNLNVYKREGSGRKVVKMAKVVKKSGNIDRGGFYLKMVLPFSLGSKQKKKNKKKNEAVGNTSSKVSPKPSASDGSGKGVVDKEWWKKSPSACKESDSGESSINSGSVKSSGSSSSNSSCSRSNSRHEKSGGRCWNFIRRPKSRTQK